jgi:hypothetical protein
VCGGGIFIGSLGHHKPTYIPHAEYCTERPVNMIASDQWREYQIVVSSTSLNKRYKISEKLIGGRATSTYGCSCPGCRDTQHYNDDFSSIPTAELEPEPVAADVRRQNIFNAVSALVSDFLYYDRKEDSQLGQGQIEAAIEEGEITVGEIVKCFREGIVSGLG